MSTWPPGPARLVCALAAATLGSASAWAGKGKPPSSPASPGVDTPADHRAAEHAPSPRQAPPPPTAAAAVAPDAEQEPLDEEDEEEVVYAPDDDDVGYGEDGAGPRLSFGWAMIEGQEDALYGRFETEYFVQQARGARVRHGACTGVLLGIDGWASSQGFGVALPTTIYVGWRRPVLPRPSTLDVFASAGLGWHWVVLDHADADGGVGILAPLVLGNVGIDLGGVRVLGEAGAQYRWQWGADDRFQLRLGGSLGLHSELWDG